MRRSREHNFAGRLVQHLGEGSRLIDAATGQTFSGRDVLRSILAFANDFRSRGLQPGDRIVIQCDLTPATLLAYLGAMYAGLVPVMMNETSVASAGSSFSTNTQAKAIWAHKNLQWKCSERELLRFEGRPQSDSGEPRTPAEVAEEDLAVLMPTSGSTGAPRLVMASHGNLIANTEAIVRSQKLECDERAMLILPLSYSFGASVAHTHLYRGGGVVFDSRFMFPDKVLRAMGTYGCTTFAGVPTVYNILLRRSSLRALPLPSVRRLLQAGGALQVQSILEISEFFPKADFFAMYGQTEATARISCLELPKHADKLGSVGQPLDNLQLRIANEEGVEVREGEIGEICVQGPSVCAGYLNDPAATGAKFSDGWLKTGDFGCVDDAGYLWIKGRTSEFVKIRGTRVSVGEVESRVAAIAGVYECAAKGIPHDEAGEALALFIVANANADGLVQRVRRALPAHWTCASVDLVPELPRTENGKIARSRLGTVA